MIEMCSEIRELTADELELVDGGTRLDRVVERVERLMDGLNSGISIRVE